MGRLRSYWRIAKFHVVGFAGSNAARGETAAVLMVDTVELRLRIRGFFLPELAISMAKWMLR